MATEFEALEIQLEESIRLSFIRNKRLKAVEKIASTIWFEEVELIRQDVQYSTYSLAEQETVGDAKEVNWLKKLAFPLLIKEQETWHRDKELDSLSRAVQNDFNSSVLLVGKSGVGKSALILELARRFRMANAATTIWETNASRMVRELTEDTGWEENFGYLCQQLTNTDDFLFIQNLTELFEVGQYEGSETSMADALQTYLGQGKISILTECTPEELSRIELRSPNFASLFHSIRRTYQKFRENNYW
jgi:ATP-dependent Clp protease ATP-binding subunit ClpA